MWFFGLFSSLNFFRKAPENISLRVMRGTPPPLLYPCATRFWSRAREFGKAPQKLDSVGWKKSFCGESKMNCKGKCCILRIHCMLKRRTRFGSFGLVCSLSFLSFGTQGLHLFQITVLQGCNLCCGTSQSKSPWPCLSVFNVKHLPSVSNATSASAFFSLLVFPERHLAVLASHVLAHEVFSCGVPPTCVLVKQRNPWWTLGGYAGDVFNSRRCIPPFLHVPSPPSELSSLGMGVIRCHRLFWGVC